jgi:hypothetical protein
MKKIGMPINCTLLLIERPELMKPKWMRWQTFERLYLKAMKAEGLYLLDLMEKAGIEVTETRQKPGIKGLSTAHL